MQMNFEEAVPFGAGRRWFRCCAVAARFPVPQEQGYFVLPVLTKRT